MFKISKSIYLSTAGGADKKASAAGMGNIKTFSSFFF